MAPVLSRWVKERSTVAAGGSAAAPTSQASVPSAEQADVIARLQRQNEQLHMERDVLKSRSRSLRDLGHEVPLHRRSPRGLSGPHHVPCARRLARGTMPGGRGRKAPRRLPIEVLEDIKRVHRFITTVTGAMAARGSMSNSKPGTSCKPWPDRAADAPSWRSSHLGGAAAMPHHRQRAWLPIAPNLLGRNFSAATPNQVWLADITYVWTGQG